MVTITSRPFTGLSNPLNAVYNGLPYVLDSNMKARPNFRYICEIYFGSAKVSELRHNPDISSDNKGVFDVGKVIENFLAVDIRFLEQPTTAGIPMFDSPKTVQRYWCLFGEEYSRMLGIISTSPYAGGSPGTLWTKFNTNYPTDISAMDGVIIGGTSKYNGWYMLNTLSADAVGIAVNYQGPAEPTGYIIPTNRGRNIGYQEINGIRYLSFLIKRPLDGTPRYTINNKVVINNGFTGTMPGFYTNSEWTVIDYRPSNQVITGTTYDMIVVNAPYKYTVASGTWLQLGSFDNIIYKNQISSENDFSYALNAARQYENEGLLPTGAVREPNWPAAYQYSLSTNPATFGTRYMKALSQRPETDTTNRITDVDICWGETYQVSYLGEAAINKISPNKANKIRMRLETWSPHVGLVGTGTWITSASVVSFFASLTYRIPGDVSANWGVGDYITGYRAGSFGVPAITFNARIVRVTTGGGYTFLFTDKTDSFGAAGTITGNIRVRYYDNFLPNTGAIVSCGPWNLKALPEMLNNSCYQYRVYPVRPYSSSYWNATGGYSVADGNGANITGQRPRVGQMFRFYINGTSCCEQNQPFKLAWLNKEGGMDFYKFTMRVDKSLDIERTQFHKKQNSVQTSGQFSYKPGARGRTNWNTRSVENWVVNSDFLTQKELDWLLNIYESPEVYLVKEGNLTTGGAWQTPVLIPLNITNTEVAVHNKAWKNPDTGKLYTYILEIEAAKNRIVQRGGQPALIAQKSLYE